VTTSQIPHLRIVVAVSAFVLVGFSGVSAYVIGWSSDLVTKGNIIGTWQNFALLAVGFWIGSSSGGKAKDDVPSDPKGPSGNPDDPITVTETRP
jgi:hypothetical protein